MDAVRVDKLYKPRPALAVKTFTIYTVLMVSCGQHVNPLGTADLTARGINPDYAAGEAARSLPYDSLKVRRRVGADKKGGPVVGLVGPFASSIITDPLWVENALRATGVDIQGTLKVECVGENCISFRRKEAITDNHMCRDLREVSKGWGLPEPRIGLTLTKEFGRSLHGAGAVRIEGEV